MVIDSSTRLIDLTVAQLAEVIDEAVREAVARNTQPDNNMADEYVHGIAGLAELLNCSPRTARRIKASGTISKAISQQGKTIVVNKRLAIQLLGRKSS